MRIPPGSLRSTGPFRLTLLAAAAVGWVSMLPAAQPARAPWQLTDEELAPALRLQAEAAAANRAAAAAGHTKTARPDAAALLRLRSGLAELQARLAALPKDEYGLPPADAAIYAEAVERQLQNDDWPLAVHESAAFTCLEWGRGVAAGLHADPDFMRGVRGASPVGYRSRVDRSAQTYMLVLPEDFDPKPARPYRLVVHLHGRSEWMRPVTWIAMTPGRLKDRLPGTIVVRPYGRGNNGFAWAAETDVWDVIADVKRRFPIDEDRVVLTGFSMGGGGTVALGLTHPGSFAAAAAMAAAVFSPSAMPAAHELPAAPARWAPLSEAEIGERVGRVYAGPALAENGLGLPWLLGCGGDDRLLQAQEALSRVFTAAGVSHTAYVVPGVGHDGGPLEARPEFRPFLFAHARDSAPREITFATATLKSPGRAWVTIEGLTAHYAKAKIHAIADTDKRTLTVRTDGIERFTVNPPPNLAPHGAAAVTVDGGMFAATQGPMTFERADGKWRRATSPLPALAKRAGLQGPVADAFTRGFLCVRPTGEPWHAAADGYARTMLAALRTHWRTQLYGELPEKDDRDVTAEDRAQYDLILFGDPGSNRLIAEALATRTPWAMPVQWEKDALRLGGESFDAGTHLPALIYPSPFAPDRYVVFNGTALARTRGRASVDNAPAGSQPLRVLPAALGDFAILRTGRLPDGTPAGQTVHGGFFDERWR